MNLCSELSVNIPLVDAFLQMSGYVKFMKELLNKKTVVDMGMVDVSHHWIVVIESTLTPKKEDSEAFTILCTITVYFFNKAFVCPHDEHKLDTPCDFQEVTPMRLLMMDHSMKRSVGIFFDILVKVDKFILPANFVVLDYNVDLEVSIILDRSFLATSVL